MGYSNYPPGVTGNEDAFGPNDETDFYDDGRVCEHCDATVNTLVTRITWNYTVEDVFTCPACGEENTVEVDVERDYPEDNIPVIDRWEDGF